MRTDTKGRALPWSKKRLPPDTGHIVTERTRVILQLLSRYRYLTAHQLFTVVGAENETAFKRRLRFLSDLGYLSRPRQQWDNGRKDRFLTLRYELGERGFDYLKAHYLYEDDYLELISRARYGGSQNLTHACMIIDTLFSIEQACKEANVRFITWREIMTTAPESTKNADNPFAFPQLTTFYKSQTLKGRLIPDAMFGLEFPHKTLYFAFEAEHRNKVRRSNLKTQNSFLKKALLYREYIKQKTFKTHYNLDNMLILTTVPTESKMERCKEVLMELSEGKGSNPFLFAAIPTLGAQSNDFPNLLTTPWQRAGRESVVLGTL